MLATENRRLAMRVGAPTDTGEGEGEMSGTNRLPASYYTKQVWCDQFYEVCKERDELRVENARLREALGLTDD